MNNISEAPLLYWNNYIENNVRSTSQSDLYDFCIKNTDTIIHILSNFDTDATASFEHKPGWIPTIVSLHRKILALVDDYIIYQIKEKFGGLRFYAQPIILDSWSPENKYHITQIFNHLITSAETSSLNICEVCSKPGTLTVHNYWYKTRCDDCS